MTIQHKHASEKPQQTTVSATVQRGIEHVVTTHPKTIFGIVLALFVGALALLPQLKVNPNTNLLPATHPSEISLRNLRETYTGSRDTVLILLETKDTVFKPQTLERIQQLTETFEERLRVMTDDDVDRLRRLANPVQGEARDALQAFLQAPYDNSAEGRLEQARWTLEMSGQLTPALKQEIERLGILLQPVLKVSSLSNTDNILGKEGELIIEPIYEDIPETAEELAALQNRALGNDLFHNILISPDSKRTGIYIELSVSNDDSDALYRIYQQIKTLLSDIPGDETSYIAGFPVGVAATDHALKRDTRWLFPVVIVLVGLGLWLTFKMLRGILVPMLVVLFSVVFTLAIMALFRIPIDIISSALPVFLIAIGVADGVHLVSEFQHERRHEGLERREAVQKILQKLSLAVIMTSVTTAGAFYLLGVTKILQIRTFGVLVGTGTLIAMLLSLVFIPVLLLLLPEPKQQHISGDSRLDRWLQNGLARMGEFVLMHPKSVLIGFGLVAIVALYGTLRVRVDSSLLSYFKPGTELRVNSERLNTRFGGSDTLNILLAVNRGEEPLKDPQNLRIIADLQAFLNDHNMVGKTTSLADLIRRMNYVMHDEDPAFNRLPGNAEMLELDGETFEIAGRDLISQYLLLYESSGGEALSDVVDYDYREANIRVLLRTNYSSDFETLMEQVREYQMTHLPSESSPFALRFSGTSNLTVVYNQEIVWGQLLSLGLSFAFVLVLLIVLFRSVITGTLGILPLIFSILVNFGVLGALGISLDIGSAIISSVVIGIGVDYSIHYLARLNRELRDGHTLSEALFTTIQQGGRAIAANATVVGIGFLALLVSEMIPVNTIGWMVALTMLVSCLATLMVIPAILVVAQPVAVLVPRDLPEALQHACACSWECTCEGACTCGHA